MDGANRMTQRILIDSSAIGGFVDRSSRANSAIAAIIDEASNEIILPAPIIPEASYVIGSRMGYMALRLFIQDLTTTAPPIENLSTNDYKRIAEVMATYADMRLDFVDAAIFALAERLQIRHILTLDRRDFSVLRPRHCEYLELLP